MSWTVTTWNIHGSVEPDLEDLAEVLRTCGADVVALQEVRQRQARRLARLLGWRSVWRRKHYPYSPLAWWLAEGHALLTPHTLRDPVRHTLSRGHRVWIYRYRIMLSAHVERDGESLTVHNLHLSSDGTDERIEQARRACGAALDIAATTRVVCGDFNAHESPEVIREFHPLGVHDPGGSFTCKSHAPVKRIDYVLVPDAATHVEVETPEGDDTWATRSDHLPVTVTFH